MFLVTLLVLGGCCGSSGQARTQRSVVIGRGKTLAGTPFVATAYRGDQPPRGQSGGVRWEAAPTWLVGPKRHATPGRDAACPVSVFVNGEGTSGGYNSCLDGTESEPNPSVDCQEGLLTVTSTTLPRTRRVRMALSDGRTVTAQALVVLASPGRSDGLYYQVVRGPSPIPVSLTELDLRGGPVRVVALPAIVECTREPLKYLPGGAQTLVTGRVPGGPQFSISAESAIGSWGMSTSIWQSASTSTACPKVAGAAASLRRARQGYLRGALRKAARHTPT